MAERDKRGGLDPDSIVKDPAAPAQQRALVGFVGKSNRQGFVRLYLNPSFDNFFEISEGDILYRRDLDTDSSPLGGTVVWIKKTAQVVQTRTRTFEVEAEYLSGRIAQQVARLVHGYCCREVGTGRPGVAAAPGTSVFLCGSTSWFLAAPDLPDPWSTSQCNSNTFGDFCTMTAEC